MSLAVFEINGNESIAFNGETRMQSVLLIAKDKATVRF